MNNKINLLRYQTKLGVLEREFEELKNKASILNRDIVNKKREIENVKSAIDGLEGKKIYISEHAVLRYLERVEGIDINKVKDKILSDTKIVDAIRTLGSGSYPIKGGILKVIDNIVVTILKN